MLSPKEHPLACKLRNVLHCKENSKRSVKWSVYISNFIILKLILIQITTTVFHCDSSEMKWSEVAQSCLTLFNPMDCSLPGSSIIGIFQARILEWVAISFSRGSCPPRNQTWVSCITGRFFKNWVKRILESDLNEATKYKQKKGVFLQIEIAKMKWSSFFKSKE